MIRFFCRSAGVIDGSHIFMVPPKDQQMSYINKKFRHSIVLQGEGIIPQYDVVYIIVFVNCD